MARFVPPEVAALINPVSCSAFALRCEGRCDVRQRTVVSTGITPGSVVAVQNVLAVDTESDACSAKLFPGMVYVEVATSLTPSQASQLSGALLTVSISKEDVIQESALALHLLTPAGMAIGVPTTAERVLLGNSDEASVMGLCQMFFLPDKTSITASISGIPSGLGDLDITVGVVLANYTTKVRQGCLYGVGALDPQMQAFPVSYPCNATFGAQGQAPQAAAAVMGAYGPTVSFGPATGLTR
jgi:hypothetical protein